jgi:tetratricopeptide (TPR) repeat protein
MVVSHDEAPNSGDLSEGQSSSAQVLRHLSETGNSERLETEARRFLELNAEDFDAHCYLGLVLIDADRYGEAKPHLDFMLRTDATSVRTQIAAVSWHAGQERWRDARRHIAEGMRIDPDCAFFHESAAIAALRELKMSKAKGHIARARELAPNDAEIANLYLRIHGATETSKKDAWTRVWAYEDALRLDPGSAEIFQSIGDVYLDELDDPKSAEKYYREALRIAPTNHEYQKRLFNAVAKRSVIYRLFSLPSRTFTWVGHICYAIRCRPWYLILLLIGFKFVLGFFVWLMLATILFWPGGKMYEWLMISELKRGATISDSELRTWHWFQRIPMWARFSLFLVVNLAIWGGILACLGAPLVEGYLGVLVISGLHFVLVAAQWAEKRVGAALARRKLYRADHSAHSPKGNRG